MAARVARITAGPIVPTTLAPVVNNPTPTTVPTVMVTASFIPKVLFKVFPLTMLTRPLYKKSWIYHRALSIPHVKKDFLSLKN